MNRKKRDCLQVKKIRETFKKGKSFNIDLSIIVLLGIKEDEGK